MRSLIYTSIILLCISARVFASGAFPLEEPTQILIGAIDTYVIKDGDTMIELAREYNLGYNEFVSANRGIDPWVPEPGSSIIIPSRWLLPETIDKGIIINLAELRLYYFFAVGENRYVTTYPIGVGKQGFNTPAGSFRITGKIKDPVWKVPENIRKERPELPAFVQAGKDNPLGKYWLQLSVDGYGIHGTNRPYGIGRRVSHGCIRLYPEDIEELSTLVNVGTRVRIVNKAIKIAQDRDKVFIEVNDAGLNMSELIRQATIRLSGEHLLQYIDTELLIRAIRDATGLPAAISK